MTDLMLYNKTGMRETRNQREGFVRLEDRNIEGGGGMTQD